MEKPDQTARQDDPHELQRFIDAQESTYDRALSELLRGKKQSHWMWYIFPQFDGLGRSEMSRRFAIKSVEEARAYLSHPVLGPRLVECSEAVLDIDGKSATEVFGSPDDLKLLSSMTLFASVSEPGSQFQLVLEKYFQGRRDEKTIRLMDPSRE